MTGPRATWVLVFAICAAKAVAAPPLPTCTPEQRQAWSEINSSWLGVQARDPNSEDISAFDPSDPRSEPPAATDTLHDWVPVDGYKTAVCGIKHHHAFFDSTGGVLVDEYDFDAFVIPFEPFTRVITDAKRRFGDVLVECCGETDPATGTCPSASECIETEVTTHRALGRDKEKWWGQEFLPDRGPACVYGPWVIDTGHTHPEIHPVQLLWVKEESSSSWVLAVLQDSSSRYTTPFEFKARRRPDQARWSPWAQAPVRGEFKVAFEATAGHPAAFVLRDVRQRNVSTHGAFPAAIPGPCTGPSAGAEGGITCSDLGQTVATARGEMPGGSVELDFGDVCRRDASTVQGYLIVRSAVGKSACGEEGFHIFRVAQEGAGVTTSSGSSVRMASTTSPDALTRRALLEASETPAPETRALQQPSPSSLVTLQPVVEREVPGNITTDSRPDLSGAWVGFTRALADPACGAPALTALPSPPPLPLKRVGDWSIALAPHYSGSATAGRLDDAVNSKNVAKVKDILNSSTPFRVRAGWTFTAFDETAGAAVGMLDERAGKTRRSGGPSGEVRVETWKESEWTAGLRVTLPASAPAAVYRVGLELTLTDTGGHEGRLSHCLWSHGLAAEDPDAILDWVLRLACPSAPTASELRRAAAPNAAGVSRPRQSAIRQLLFGLATAAGDHLVALEEVGHLIEGARKVCTTP